MTTFAHLAFLRASLAVADHELVAKRWGGWASVLALALWGGACASSATPTGVPLPTLPQNFPSHGSSIIEVRLIFDVLRDCIFVDYNGTRLPAKWPFGYTWMKDHSGVQSPDGKHVARIGELARVIGIRGHVESLQFGVGATAPSPNSSCAPEGDDTLLISGIV